MNEDMKRLFKIFLTVIAAVVALDGSAQNIAAKKSRLATGANGVTVVEQSEVSDAVRSVESRAKRTKVCLFCLRVRQTALSTWVKSIKGIKIGQKWGL